MRLHSHLRRSRAGLSRRVFRWGERVFLIFGLLGLGASGVIYLRACIYQAREARRFAQSLERSMAGEHLGPPPPPNWEAADGAVIGRLDIPRLGLSVMVREGDRSGVLRLAAGHIPGTALPGQPGNVGIAAHRDTFFRALRKIRLHDTITLTTLSGTYRYSVESLRIVSPADTEVLDASSRPALTLVTCYPFYYLGPAPKRFIVCARQTGADHAVRAATVS